MGRDKLIAIAAECKVLGARPPYCPLCKILKQIYFFIFSKISLLQPKRKKKYDDDDKKNNSFF